MKKICLSCPKCGRATCFEKPTYSDQIESIQEWIKSDPLDELAKETMEDVFNELRSGKKVTDFDDFHYQVTPKPCRACGKFFLPSDTQGVDK